MLGKFMYPSRMKTVFNRTFEVGRTRVLRACANARYLRLFAWIQQIRGVLERAIVLG
jgi:hypothetical protein